MNEVWVVFKFLLHEETNVLNIFSDPVKAQEEVLKLQKLEKCENARFYIERFEVL